MTTLENTGEGTSGTAVAATSIGAPNAFDTSSTSGTGTTITFDNAEFHNGSTSYKFSLAAVASTAYLMWTSSSVPASANGYAVLYVYLTANPTVTTRLASFMNGGSLCAGVSVNSTGKLVTQQSTGGNIATTTGTIPLNQWVRVEFECLSMTGTTATVNARMYQGESTTAVTNGTLSTAGAAVTQATLNGLRVGPTNTTTQTTAWAYWCDSIGYSDTAQIGPWDNTTNVTLADTATGTGSLSVSSPLISTLTDTFDILDTTKWVTGTTGPAGITPTVSGGKLNITAPGASKTVGYGYVTSASTYDLRNGAIYVQVTPTAQNYATTELGLGDPAGVGAQLECRFEQDSSGTAVGFYLSDTTTGFTSSKVTWNAASMAWWRLRFDTTGATVYADTSPDGVTWTNQITESTSYNAASSVVFLQAGSWDVGSATTALFDNVNIVATVVPVSDAGTGTGVLSATATVPLTDTLSGDDEIVTSPTQGLTDTGTGADVFATPSPITVPLPETGTGDDEISVSSSAGTRGTWRSGIYYGNANLTTEASFAAWTGRPPAYLHTFQTRDTWTNYEGPGTDAVSLNGTAYGGANWMLSVAPFPTGDTGYWPAAAAGTYDTHYVNLGKYLVANGQANCMIRFAWEYNLNSQDWSTNAVSTKNPTGVDQQANMAAAWLRFHDRMREQGWAGLLLFCPSHGMQASTLPDPANVPNTILASGNSPVTGKPYFDGIIPDAYNRQTGPNTSTYTERWTNITSDNNRGMYFWRDYCTSNGITLFGFGEWGGWVDSSTTADDYQYCTDMRSFLDDCRTNHGLNVMEAYFDKTAVDGDHYIGPGTTQLPNTAASYLANGFSGNMTNPSLTDSGTGTDALSIAGSSGTTLENTGEGTSGTAVAATSIGAPNAFDTSSTTGGLAITFDNGQAHNGATSYLFSLPAAAATGYLMWTSNSITASANGYATLYVYLTANPTVTTRLASFLNGGSLCAGVSVNSAGKLVTQSSTGANIATTTGTIPLAQWVRIEFECLSMTGTTATVNARMYAGDSTTAVTNGTLSTAGAAVTQATLNGLRIGPTNTTTQTTAWSYWCDSVAYSNSAQVGPWDLPGTGITLTDTATGTGAITVTPAVPLPDTGSGADGFAATFVIPLTDTGTGADVFATPSPITVPLPDTWIGLDVLQIAGSNLTNTPASRTLTVPAEGRGWAVPAETRVCTVPADTRGYEIPAETRVCTVPADTRQLIGV